MKIRILTDGKYGDRAEVFIKKKYPETKLVIIEGFEDAGLLDEVELDETVEKEIEEADLLISYVRHPDVVFEICDRGKPIIVAINFGEGFLRQVREENPKVIMPPSMCSLLPDTGVQEFDEFARQFGKPIYDLEIEPNSNIIKDIRVIVESPCGATITSLDFLINKPLTPKTINEFVLNVRHECREPVSLMMQKSNLGDSSSAIHLLQFIDGIKKKYPEKLDPNTELGKYLAQKKEEMENFIVQIKRAKI
ncbi:MAG: DUF166 family protein [Candidatus Helarchaeota archaeon]